MDYVYSMFYATEKQVVILPLDDPVRIDALNLPSNNINNPQRPIIREMGGTAIPVKPDEVTNFNNFLNGHVSKRWVKQTYNTNFIIPKFGHGYTEDLMVYKALEDNRYLVVAEINILDEDGYFIDIFDLSNKDIAYERITKQYEEDALLTFQLEDKIKLKYRLIIGCTSDKPKIIEKLHNYALQRLVLNVSKLSTCSDIQHMLIKECLTIN